MNGIRLQYGLIVFACCFFAVIFYANFRDVTWLGQQMAMFQYSHIQQLSIPSMLLNHLPSILQTVFLSICFLFISLHLFNKTINPAVCALFVASSLEALQLTPLMVGTFDWYDLVSICLTALTLFFLTQSQKRIVRKNANKQSTILITLFGSYLLSVGCVVPDECNDSHYTCITPVTLKWEELRADIIPSYADETVLTSPGKIHKNNQHLFIVDNYRGVHIFEHSDTQNPTRLVFIPVMGALDISIQGDFIYINSFTDLVIVNYQAVLNGSFTQNNISRKENIFAAPLYSTFLPNNYALNGPYDHYDNYLVGRYSTREDIPVSGIIIGYYNLSRDPIIYGEYDSDPTLVEVPNETDTPQQIGG